MDDDFAHGIGRIKAISFAAVPQIIEKGIVILPLGRHKSNEKIFSAMIAAPLSITREDYIAVVVIRQNKIGDTRLYVHEVTLKEKLLAGSSNPIFILATKQGVSSENLAGSSNPTHSLTANQGNIANVLQNILSVK